MDASSLRTCIRGSFLRCFSDPSLGPFSPIRCLFSYCKLQGYNALYVCGTDEYGTATETKALQEGLTPREICDKYHVIHKQVYEWFGIDFDVFGRTTTEWQTRISQSIFNDIQTAGLVSQDEMVQLFCEKDQKFLADRFVEGSCPHCSFVDARGDQCDSCGKLLNPSDLINPRCKICGTQPVPRKTRHLFLELPSIADRLETWVNSVSPNWTSNSVNITKSWLTKGLEKRCITRDLKWGTPVPLAGFTDKVFYVWFDAPIGYISITANYTPEWERWWKNPVQNDVRLVQFMGKDNVPFHTVIFPSSLLATGQDWTLLSDLSTTEYLNYEGGKFSKSRGTGVFGDQAAATGIAADVWRYYLLANRPEAADADLNWDDLKLRNNSELADNLGNFVNRALKFAQQSFENRVPELQRNSLTESELRLETAVSEQLQAYCQKLEKSSLKEGIKIAMAISKLGNQYLQDCKPWVLVKEDLPRCGVVISTAISLSRLIALVVWPYMPFLSANILYNQLNLPRDGYPRLPSKFELPYLPANHVLGEPVPLFRKISDDEIKALRARFSGVVEGTAHPFPLELRVGKVASAKPHPEADNLYVLTVSLGDSERTVVAGIRAQYSAEKLQDRLVVLCCNLKPTKFKGINSEGMLLAATKNDRILLLEPAGQVPAGTPLSLPGYAMATAASPKYDGKKVKSLPFEITTGLGFKGASFAAGAVPIVVLEAGDWSGSKIY